MGLEIGEEHFYTSALATAKFLQNQAPGCSAYVIGDHGLYNALYDAGITINDVDPDYVVVGETVTYGYEHIITAMNLVNKGARLIATNTDIIAGIETGLDTALVLSGVSTRETVKEFPYRPRLILNGVGDIAE